MVVDQFGDGAKAVLLCQVKLSVLRGANVIMSAIPPSLPRKPESLVIKAITRTLLIPEELDVLNVLSFTAV